MLTILIWLIVLIGILIFIAIMVSIFIEFARVIAEETQPEEPEGMVLRADPVPAEVMTPIPANQRYDSVVPTPTRRLRARTGAEQ
uniref:Uncharacterized protein n=1 Tax=Panagrolaimus sp. JU765 TaxID=591449 RepID=A0AC34R1L9_9BILA